MSLGENFHPELGYVAPTRSFMSYFRVALVSMTIGAASGAAVVAALADRSGSREGVSTAARSLVTNAPVAAAAENASFDNATIAVALSDEATQRESLGAHIPAPGAAAAPVAHELASPHTASPAPSPALAGATDNTGPRADGLAGAGSTAAWRTAPSKVIIAKRSLPKTYQWQTTTNGGNYRHNNFAVAPPYRLQDRRPFIQLGFGETRDEWR
jgi:hypothetical protein